MLLQLLVNSAGHAEMKNAGYFIAHITAPLQLNARLTSRFSFPDEIQAVQIMGNHHFCNP